MNLYLMQHSKARPEKEDPEESLSDEGIRILEKTGEKLVHLIPSLDQIVSSPKKRAKQTALIVAEHLKFSANQIAETDSVKAKVEPSETVQFLASLKDANALLVVGHLPSLQRLAQKLTGAKIAFQNGGCVALNIEDWHSHENEILWILPPEL